MKLIADSGSTKTDWVLVDNGKIVKEFNTIGLNPYMNTKEMIMDSIRNELMPTFCTSNIKNTHLIEFYGAGCSQESKSKVIKDALHSFFPFSEITVNHDLLGAAKAACGNKKGIAVILGTGSNSCFFDGNQIIDNVLSLGYILGDEGSGCYMGKRILQDYLNKDMPEPLREILFDEKGITTEIVFENVYKKPRPNKYMASFSTWISKHYKQQSYLQKLVENSFDDFFNQHIIKYKNHKTLPINVVGSVGFAFQDELRKVALKHKCKIGNVIKSPLEGLIKI